MNRDQPLAAHGHDQAVELANLLSSPQAVAPYPIPEQVFSSPFYRCIQTALPTQQALSAEPSLHSSSTYTSDADPTAQSSTPQLPRDPTQPPKSRSGSRSRHPSRGMKLEHGVAEWYSPVIPNTGLHPRPSDPEHLSTLFPPGSIDTSYTSTVYPSRRGEDLAGVQDRADLFIEAWTARVEELGLRSVVVFGHAASVIVLGRALTGDKALEVPAASASCSLYRRRRNSSTSTTQSPPAAGSDSDSATDLMENDAAESERYCGVGEWEPVWLGRTDHLSTGQERNWSFREVHIVNGTVISDSGDAIPHPPEDTIPTGLAPGMERYLRRGMPKSNGSTHEMESIKLGDT